MAVEENIRSLIESIGDALFSLDNQGRFTYVSPVIEQLISFRAEEMAGQPIARFVHREELPGFLQSLRQGLEGSVGSFEFRALSKTGERRHIRASIRPLASGNQSGGLVGILSDITEWKSAEEKMRLSSFKDGLTGLYNRAYFEEEMTRLDTVRQLPLSVILGDVNGLKLINDVFGHSAGDQLLLTAARILKESCRREDVIARTGGDEFSIFLPATSHPATLEIIGRIKRACLNNPQDPIKLSIALGAVTKEEITQDLRALMKGAEDSMYRSKLVEGKSFRASIISSIRRILSEKRDETEEHVRRLYQLTMQLGRHLGSPKPTLEGLALLSILHDIGEIVLPETIGARPDDLSEEGWRMFRRHPEVGYRIAASCPELAHIAEAILSHHEWWNGKGYPRGLKGEGIPTLSRIFSIADAYDEMTRGRFRKQTMGREAAVDAIKSGSGTQFDPMLVKAFLEISLENAQASTFAP